MAEPTLMSFARIYQKWKQLNPSDEVGCAQNGDMCPLATLHNEQYPEYTWQFGDYYYSKANKEHSDSTKLPEPYREVISEIDAIGEEGDPITSEEALNILESIAKQHNISLALEPKSIQQ